MNASASWMRLRWRSDWFVFDLSAGILRFPTRGIGVHCSVPSPGTRWGAGPSLRCRCYCAALAPNHGDSSIIDTASRARGQGWRGWIGMGCFPQGNAWRARSCFEARVGVLGPNGPGWASCGMHSPLGAAADLTRACQLGSD